MSTATASGRPRPRSQPPASASWRKRARAWLPRDHAMPHQDWSTRHRWVTVVLLLQVALLPGFAYLRGYGALDSLADLAVPLALGAGACSRRLSDLTRSTLASLGLMSVSTAVVHLSGGYIEAHFHFFVMVPIIACYQRWLPFGLSIGLVLLTHGVMGTVDPAMMYNHPAGQAHPWIWAGVHAFAIAATSVGVVVNWKLHERTRDAEQSLTAQLAHQVNHDSLTGLPSRSQFLELVAAAQADGIATGRPPVVLVMDLDGFKDVNDTFGHHYGDMVLMEVAARLRDCVRREDVVTRLGGDEFAVLLVDGDARTGDRTAEQISGALSVPFDLDGPMLDLEVSIGVAVCGGAVDAPALLRWADAAMYVAKDQRLGWTHYTEDLEDTTGSRLEMLGDLRRALDADEIVLHYQPQTDLVSGRTVGLEALARWQHPTRGLLPPSDFIPMVERSNLSRRFTSYVLDLALSQTRAWQEEGLELPVAVNVSTRCLLDPRLPDQVAAQLAAHRVPASMLCLEITEDTVMANPLVATDILQRVRALGVRVSVDDFGTGYSSMAYLKTLPLDELKIDRSFVMDLGNDETDAVLVRSAVDLAHDLHLSVVAEGVEDAATLDRLRVLGCDTAQGYHMARPLPPLDLVPWLEARAATYGVSGEPATVVATLAAS